MTVSGEGTVTGKGINCPGDCSESYTHGEKVTLTATPKGSLNPTISHSLGSWAGCDSTSDETCSVTMNVAKNVSATFQTEPVCPAGCEVRGCGGTKVCKCSGATCPANYAQVGNCTTTRMKECTGDTDGCGRGRYDTTCETTQHPFGPQPRETCLYENRDRQFLSCRRKTRTCFADIVEVGCLFSITIDTNPDIGGAGEEEEVWSDYELGGLLPTFECGTVENTCDVTFGDETVTTNDYGVVDKEDTATQALWECHSDNGTVSQCSLPKAGGGG